MKFAKGILTESEKLKAAEQTPVPHSHADASGTGKDKQISVAPMPSAEVEKDRLFQTVKESDRSGKHYLIVLLVLCIAVAVTTSVAWYVMRPGVGDRITAPRGLDVAMRNHFLEKEKCRVATDIAFYQCEGLYWARVGVETRTDLPNPLFRVDTYSANAKQADAGWSISAKPAPSSDTLIPCS